jgi:signal transduction histidine kinase
MDRYARARRQQLADLAVAGVVYAVTLLTTIGGPAGGRLDVAAAATAAAACSALVVRRRWPFPVLVVSAVAAEAYLVHFGDHHGSMVLAAPLIALYTVADASTGRRALIIGVLAVLASASFHMLTRPTSWLGADNLALAALGGLAVAAGDASRNRRAYLSEVEARARHAEFDREAEAARRVTEERLRIARDLHDAVGHHLALIYVQTGVAIHLLSDPPTQARDALGHVREASRTALGELSATIGLLRQPDEQAEPTDPVVGLAGVDELLVAFRRSGLAIAEQVDGPARPIPMAADLTAYRVIQESLTNVRKHAGPTAVAVCLTYEPDALRILVENKAAAHPPRPGGGPAGAGHGLIGMRERVTALGGKLHAGPRPDGGYRVAAVLPLTAGAA